ncbi:DUF1841 family protein [Inhella gelatinilytica]|uniref:DUF1841 family protein n=1 Tax=Inhella gelatinilytica TaxID=2795030 RepID=A0A931NES9_9BURK|nr:DUF1841 family protein [Inhella gelatinilytica]MBH9553535.1 DUF1841 family protein [Inhella gelatinilytica]
MYTPSQLDVRRFFCTTYRQWRQGLPLDPMQKVAQPWVAAHPEYFPELEDEATALALNYRVEDGKTNPFLHLAMHLTLAEQLSIDQPAGIRQAVELLAARLGSLHEAHHVAMDALGEMIWESQRSGLPPDGHAYLDRVRQRATRDTGA